VTDVTFQAPEPFRCEIARDGDTVWVRPQGELDIDTAPELEQELATVRGNGSPRLVLDLRRLTFMDSTGLRLVLRWDAAARDEGFEFAIVPGSEVVQRVIQLTGMEDHLTVTEPPADGP
jgi:anti-sigma B factor antagonist